MPFHQSFPVQPNPKKKSGKSLKKKLKKTSIEEEKYEQKKCYNISF